jgi:transcriptional regulator with XRE-family HTH domain
MLEKYPVVNVTATGEHIKSLRESRNLSVKQLQQRLGFAEPQAIYKWQRGKSLPSIDNLVLLREIFKVGIDNILIVEYMEDKK